MDTAQLDEIMVQVRQLGDGQASAAIQKCKLLAPLVDDKHGRSYIAKALEASPTIVRKWARAGVVILSGIFPEEGPYKIDYYAEVYEWPEDQWQMVADLTDWADLNAAELKKLRTFVQAMREGQHHWCPTCGHGEEEEW
jgi:hypothetical protein